MSVNVRMARPSDWAAIQRFHAEQNRLQGTNTALPQLFGADGGFARNIALAMVVERDGHPVSSFYFELVPEVCFAGCDAKATAVAQREIDRIAFALRAMGFTGLQCKVPTVMDSSIQAPLRRAGFEEDQFLVHYFKDLRLPPAAESE